MKNSPKQFVAAIVLFSVLLSCNNNGTNSTANKDSTQVSDTTAAASYDTTFKVEAEAFADIQVLRYQVPGFSHLSLQQKQLAYYLYEAALSGREIAYDQRGKYNILVRKTLEAAYGSFAGDKNSDDWKKFEEYCGRVWFSNGNHHHYGNEKFIPACSFEYFSTVVKASDSTQIPKDAGESIQAFLNRIKPIVYDLKFEPKLVDQSESVFVPGHVPQVFPQARPGPRRLQAIIGVQRKTGRDRKPRTRRDPDQHRRFEFRASASTRRNSTA